MTAVEALGFVAAGLVLATFCMRRLVPLRGMAIASNLAFILYGYIAGIGPVLVLHFILLPVNIIRLMEALHSPPRATPTLRSPFRESQGQR